jgi:glycine/D-amino acid oxidase-like deaminating enzyme
MVNSIFTDDDCLWRKTAPPSPQVTSLEGNHKCDVVIVGSGITGLRAALELSVAGLDVIVLEKNVIGFGASGRSGGQVNLGFKQDPDELENNLGHETATRMLKAASGSSQELFDLIKKYQMDCDAVQKGWLKASHCNVALDRQKRQQEQWSRRGVDLKMLSRQDVERKSGARGYVGGLLYSLGGSIQPLSFTRELARVSLQNGTRIFENADVQSFEKKTKGTLVHCTNGFVQADNVLICTNGYTDRAWPGLVKTVVPVRSIQAATEPLPESLRNAVLPDGNTLSDMRRIIYYFRLDRDYRLCFGGVGPMRDNLGPGDFDSLMMGALSVFPCLKGINWEHHWGGRMGMTNDSLPHIHELSPGVFAGLGFNGRGVGLGTLMGRVLSEVILGNDRRTLDIPVTSPNPFPFYGFRKLGFHMAKAGYTLMDRIDLMRS